MRNFTVLSLLKNVMTNRAVSTVLIVGLWFIGMFSASLPLVLFAGVLSVAWPQLSLYWHKSWRDARNTKVQNEARLAIANAL